MKERIFKSIFILFFLYQSVLLGGSDDLEVYPDFKSIQVFPGESGAIILNLEIPEKSYIYGNPKGPGIGRPTTIEVGNPDNFIFESPKFPPPKRYKAKADPDYVWIYQNGIKISIPFKTRKDSKTGEYKIPVFLTALLCTDRSCTLHELTIEYTVRVVQGRIKGGDGADLISSADPISPSQGKGSDEIHPGGNNSALSRDLSSFRPRYTLTYHISNIIQAIIYGLLAGFLLNFMPCVLPVISLKIMDIIRFSGHNRKEIRKMGFIFTLGILVTFVFLASLVAFLGYTWGGLFQQSVFLIIMIAVVFVFALSMFEVFTINIPSFAGKATQDITNKHLQAFAKGLLATLLATPCSGPFLGGALAWASTQPPAVIFIIFSCVGLGMSAPYMILTANPRLMRFIPQPGSWMIVFENIMAFLLFGTAIYLIGILKESLIMPTIWFLLFITIAFWQYGKYGSIIMPKRKRIVSRAAVILIISLGCFLSYNYIYEREEEFEVIESNKNDFTLSLLFENRDNGKISMVDFTADWCPNCKLVEKTSLYTAKVAEAVKKNDIELMVADLTRENPEAKELLTALGSRSIPFLAVFPAWKDFFEPICLRDIYSEDDVLNAIETALSD